MPVGVMKMMGAMRNKGLDRPCNSPQKAGCCGWFWCRFVVVGVIVVNWCHIPTPSISVSGLLKRGCESV